MCIIHSSVKMKYSFIIRLVISLRLTMKITTASQLSRFKLQRSACIPYVVTINEDGSKKIYFLLGRDRRTGDITDFGGGVKINNLVDGLRELNEETRDVLKSKIRNINKLAYCPAVSYENSGFSMSCLFLPLKNINMDDIILDFEHTKFSDYQKFKQKTYNEIDEIIWFDEDEFRTLLNYKDRRMWKKLKLFYSKVLTTEIRNILIQKY